jgi:type III restriction enzyme
LEYNRLFLILVLYKTLAAGRTARLDSEEDVAVMSTKSGAPLLWLPGVNNLGQYGRWASAEFTEVYQIESDFEARVEAEFDRMIEEALEGNGLTMIGELRGQVRTGGRKFTRDEMNER